MERSPVLVEDRPARFLKEHVVARVAGLELGLDFLVEIVADILRLPQAIPEHLAHGVHDGGIWYDRLSSLQPNGGLGDHDAVGQPCTMYEKIFKSRRNSALVFDTKLVE